MNAPTIKPDPIKHTMTIEVAIDPTFIECLVEYNEVFRRDHSGYWAYGLQVNGGWLVYEMAGEALPTDKEIAAAERAYVAHQLEGASALSLPDKWRMLDRAVAIRAWEEGVKRWGVAWYQHTDGNREDVVVQLALLGEIRYG